MSSAPADLSADDVAVRPLKSETRLIDKVSLELLPEHAAKFDPACSSFAPGSFVFLTHIPGKPLNAQREAVEIVREKGFEPVPHLAARNFASVDEYVNHLRELTRRGAKSVLMIGGNPSNEKTAMESAIELLRHPVVGETGLERVFIGGHPEGHPVIAQETLRAALIEKVSLGQTLGLETSIVTQFGFDGIGMANWARNLRRDGIDIPIRFGVAGVTSLPKLIKFAMLCGVGPSISAIARQGGALFKVMRDQDPSDVIGQLEADARNQGLGDIALHFFPFGGWERTTAWLDAERKHR
jgi:methylenetetrahydrofolate reductase (NADPH)